MRSNVRVEAGSRAPAASAWDHLLNEYRADSENRKEMMSSGSLNHVQNVHLATLAASSAEGGRVEWYLLKCKHLWNEKQEAPHPHDDIGGHGDQEQSADSHITPSHHQR